MQVQGPLRAVGLQGEEGRVPGGVDLQEVVVAPVLPASLQQVEPRLRATLHLQGVDQGVLGPHIVRSRLQGPMRRRFRRRIVAQFLQPEGLHARHVGIGRIGRVPGLQGPRRTAAQPRRFAQEEVQLVAGVQGDRVAGPGLEQVVQPPARPRPVPRRPGPDHRKVRRLPGVRRDDPAHPRHARRPGSAFRGHQAEIGAQHPPEGAVRVRRRGLEVAHGLRTHGVEGRHGLAQGLDRPGVAPGLQSEPVLHVRVPLKS